MSGWASPPRRRPRELRRAASERFYDTVLRAIGIARTASGEHYTEWGDFSVALASPHHPVTRGLHILLDPDGNSAEAVHYEGALTGGVDHLWIRVADVDASKRFYETIAPHVRVRLRTDTPERAQFTAGPGSFSVLSGDHLTENLHMAFPASDNRAVDDFHRAALEAGYRDNGGRGERPEYHAGYYGAFVLDPDGNNVELVSHNR